MTTYLGKSCSFGFPRVPFVNCRQFMYLVISLLVLRAGCGIWLYQFLIIAYLFTLNADANFPHLLPPKDRLTTPIIQEAHATHLHSGLESTVTYLRQKLWIPRIRQRVKSAIHKCTFCCKVLGQPYRAPAPPPLPKVWLRESPPFTVTGVDFTGALYIKSKDGMREKVYICLFTCVRIWWQFTWK